MLGRELLRVPGRVAGAGERTDRDVVGPDVVGVSVAAEFVVGRYDVRLVAPDEPDQPAGGFVQICQPEGARVAVARPTHHVRVVIAQALPFRHAKDAHGCFQLGRSELAEPPVVVRRVHLGHDDLAHLAAGAGDQDDPAALGDGLGHRSSGADRLVVGVGVHGHQGQAVARRVGRHGPAMLSQPVLSGCVREERPVHP